MIKLSRPQCPNKGALNSGNYKHRENKCILQSSSFDKCMYCESKTSHTYYGDVEHIKPKSRFPELEFEWENLGFVCRICNGNKSDKFDTTLPFINPYDENPEEHVLAFGSIIRQKQGSERGELTINQIGLNRVALVERRTERLDQIEMAINSCFRTSNQTLRDMALHELVKEAGPDKEYSLCVKSMLLAHQLYDQSQN